MVRKATQYVSSSMTSQKMYSSFSHKILLQVCWLLTSQKLWQPQVPFSSPPWAQLLDPLEGWAGCSSSCPPSLHLLLLPSQFFILTLFPSLPFKLSSSAVHSPFLSFASSFPAPSSSFSLFPPSQFPHRHLHQLKTVHLLLSGRSWRRSSPAHAAAPAGPAALPSAGQVEPEPESPHSPPTSPPIPAQETSSCWEVEGGWVGLSSVAPTCVTSEPHETSELNETSELVLLESGWVIKWVLRNGLISRAIISCWMLQRNLIDFCSETVLEKESHDLKALLFVKKFKSKECPCSGLWHNSDDVLLIFWEKTLIHIQTDM